MASDQFKLVLEGQAYDLERREGQILVNGVAFSCQRQDSQLVIAGAPHQVKLSSGSAEVDGIRYAIEVLGLEAPRAARPGRRAVSLGAAPEAGAVTAIMPGLIVTLLKQEGDRVAVGDPVLVLEAMKMQNEVQASTAGLIRELKVKEGDAVEMRQVLFVIV